LQMLANQLPDSFADPKRVTKSYVPACNAPISIGAQGGPSQAATETRPQDKRGRPKGSKDKNPRKTKKGARNDNTSEVVETVQDKTMADHDVPNTATRDAGPHGTNGSDGPNSPTSTAGIDNNEISINYVLSGLQWNRNDIDVNDIFA